MAAWEGKKYKLEKSENLDAYMEALGVSAENRKLGNTIIPTVYLVKNGDEYEYTTASTVRNQVMKFKPEVEFEMETADGRKMMTIFHFENANKLIQEEKSGKGTTIIREFTDSELVATCTVSGVTAVMHYKAV